MYLEIKFVSRDQDHRHQRGKPEEGCQLKGDPEKEEKGVSRERGVEKEERKVFNIKYV